MTTDKIRYKYLILKQMSRKITQYNGYIKLDPYEQYEFSLKIYNSINDLENSSDVNKMIYYVDKYDAIVNIYKHYIFQYKYFVFILKKICNFLENIINLFKTYKYSTVFIKYFCAKFKVNKAIMNIFINKHEKYTQLYDINHAFSTQYKKMYYNNEIITNLPEPVLDKAQEIYEIQYLTTFDINIIKIFAAKFKLIANCWNDTYICNDTKYTNIIYFRYSELDLDYDTKTLGLLLEPENFNKEIIPFWHTTSYFDKEIELKNPDDILIEASNY